MPVVLYEKRGRIAYVTLNRPEAMNAINEEMHKQLWDTSAYLAVCALVHQ